MDVVGVVTSLSVGSSAAHLTVGGAVASVGINVVMLLSFTMLTWWTMSDEEDMLERPLHAPEKTAEDFPLPDFLYNAGYERTINIGVFGMSGAGKSSLVNALRGRRPGEIDAAAVGVEETTLTPVAYNLIDTDQIQTYETEAAGEPLMQKRAVHIWDLPGAGTAAFPSKDCVREMGLRFFDVIILVVSGTVTETDLNVADELNKFKVPYFVVRSQVDCDVENEMADSGATAEEAESLFRKEMTEQGFSSTFLVSARQPESYDFHQLVSNIIASVQARRRIRKDEACPICYEKYDDAHQCCRCQWCRNTVCGLCAEQLQGKLDETPCPFCRRWTTLSSHNA